MGRVRHVRSGGEVQVLTPAEMVFVDGFDQEINTIYEFYGCYFHGCSREIDMSAAIAIRIEP